MSTYVVKRNPKPEGITKAMFNAKYTTLSSNPDAFIIYKAYIP